MPLQNASQSCSHQPHTGQKGTFSKCWWEVYVVLMKDICSVAGPSGSEGSCSWYMASLWKAVTLFCPSECKNGTEHSQCILHCWILQPAKLESVLSALGSFKKGIMLQWYTAVFCQWPSYSYYNITCTSISLNDLTFLSLFPRLTVKLNKFEK